MPVKTKLIACATVLVEIPSRLLDGVDTLVLEAGLHNEPGELRQRLQEAIDAASSTIETILFGYGLCAQAVVGLRSGSHNLVVPRVDDCIALFLGSCAAYRQQARSSPGTYFLSKGWIEEGITPFHEYDQWVVHYGEQRAQRILHYLLSGYRRLALINTGQYELDPYRAFTQATAARFTLDCEEVQGSTSLMERLLTGKWDEDFLVISPGGIVEYSDFLPMLLDPSFKSQSLILPE